MSLFSYWRNDDGDRPDVEVTTYKVSQLSCNCCSGCPSVRRRTGSAPRPGAPRTAESGAGSPRPCLPRTPTFPHTVIEKPKNRKLGRIRGSSAVHTIRPCRYHNPSNRYFPTLTLH
eukprot:1901778-Pyramimonas_sp.AAC.1